MILKVLKPDGNWKYYDSILEAEVTQTWAFEDKYKFPLVRDLEVFEYGPKTLVLSESLNPDLCTVSFSFHRAPDDWPEDPETARRESLSPFSEVQLWLRNIKDYGINTHRMYEKVGLLNLKTNTMSKIWSFVAQTENCNVSFLIPKQS